MSVSSQQEELSKFAALAAQWWDREGEMRTLHDINPARLDFIEQRAPLAGKKVLDVGCGAGILSEAMALAGAEVTGIDLAPELLDAARVHAEQTGAQVQYECISSRDYAAQNITHFDIVTCMEMLEHVPEPSVIVDDCAHLAKPGGQLFFSTINRNPKSWLLAIAGAEYLLGLVPQGTHEYAKLIKPSELSQWARAAKLDVQEIVGMHYNPLLHTARIGGSPDVNYFLHAVK